MQWFRHGQVRILKLLGFRRKDERDLIKEVKKVDCL